MKKNNFILFILILGLVSCQPVEFLNDVDFDYSKYQKITFNVKDINVNNNYRSKFSDIYIDHSIEDPPIDYLNTWLEANIVKSGDQNYLTINIIEASLKKTEVPNIDFKKFEDRYIFLFEVSLLVEFILYDDSNIVLSNAIIESKRSITSRKFISLEQNKRIIDLLIFDCLDDFSNKSLEVLQIHMNKFIF